MYERASFNKALDTSQRLQSEGNVARIARKLWPLLLEGERAADENTTLKMLRAMSEIKDEEIEKATYGPWNAATRDMAFNNLVCLFFR